MPLGQSLAWKRGDLLGAAQRLTFAVGAGLWSQLALAALPRRPGAARRSSGLAAYLIVGSFADVGARICSRRRVLGAVLAAPCGLPRSAWGTAFAHAGIGVTLARPRGDRLGRRADHLARPGELDARPLSSSPSTGSDEARAGRTIPKSWRVRRSARAASSWPTVEPAKRSFPRARRPSPRPAS